MKRRSACLHVCFVNIVPGWAGRGRFKNTHNHLLLCVAFARTRLTECGQPLAVWLGKKAGRVLPSGRGLQATTGSGRGRSVFYALVRGQSASPASLGADTEIGVLVLAFVPKRESASPGYHDTQPPRNLPLALLLQIQAWATSHTDMN